MSDQSVTQLNCVAERFHCQRALCDSGQSEEIRYRSECENKMVVFDCVRVPIESMRDNNLFFLGVDLVHIATEKIHVANHFPDRINDVCQIQIARGDLMQHRREKKKVLAINDSHLKPRVPKLFELQRCVKPAKAATENEDTGFVTHRNRVKGHSAPVGVIRLTTMPGMGSRGECEAVQRHKFPICDPVRSDLDALAS